MAIIIISCLDGSLDSLTARANRVTKALETVYDQMAELKCTVSVPLSQTGPDADENRQLAEARPARVN